MTLAQTLSGRWPDLHKIRPGGHSMYKLIFACSCNLVLVASAFAQKPAAEKSQRVTPAWQEGRVVSSSELTPTPEMWFYEQERRRWDDPQMLVRAHAEEKAAQRRA